MPPTSNEPSEYQHSSQGVLVSSPARAAGSASSSCPLLPLPDHHSGHRLGARPSPAHPRWARGSAAQERHRPGPNPACRPGARSAGGAPLPQPPPCGTFRSPSLGPRPQAAAGSPEGRQGPRPHRNTSAPAAAPAASPRRSAAPPGAEPRGAVPRRLSQPRRPPRLNSCPRGRSPAERGAANAARPAAPVAVAGLPRCRTGQPRTRR